MIDGLKQYKYYGLAAVGAIWAAAADSLVLLGLTTAVVILLMLQDKEHQL